MEICTCHYKEDLTWLLEGSQWPVTVVHKEGGDPVTLSKGTLWTIPNVGVEATAYLWYIIQRYETLPDHVAFIHGHETSHHQQGGRPLLEMIRDAQVHKYNFVPLNNFWYCIQLQGALRNYIQVYKNLELDTPENFIVCGSAQFIVSRYRILARRKAYYEKLYERITSREIGNALEYVWHHIFGEPWVHVPRDDHFAPPLDRVLYSGCGSIPMRYDDFKLGYIGQNPPDERVSLIRSRDEYEALVHQCVMIVCCTDDKAIDLTDDTNKIAWVHRDNFINFLLELHLVRQLYEKLYLEALAS